MKIYIKYILIFEYMFLKNYFLIYYIIGGERRAYYIS
jgi:hypothetical protein